MWRTISRLSISLDQSVLVESSAGASGTIAADAVAKSRPDGYTVMMGTKWSKVIKDADIRPQE